MPHLSISESDTVKDNTTTNDKTDIANILGHMKHLEETKLALESQLKQANDRITSLSAEKRASMESALNTVINTWVSAVETKDESTKADFLKGCKALVDKSDEGSGVWQMMVAASNLHARQEHDLDKLRSENKELKTRFDGMYDTSDARTDGKRARTDAIADTPSVTIWDDFAKSMQQF